jgi:hypothetical protein
MVRKWAVVILTILLALVVLAPPAMATHKAGHDYPPGCFNEPPAHARDHKCWRHGFGTPPEGRTSLARLRRLMNRSFSQEADPSGISVWMIALVTAGTFSVVLMADHRRRAQALRRRLRA